MKLTRFDPALLEPERVARRRLVMATLVLAIVAPAALLMADLHWRTGYDGWRVAHLIIFLVLFTLVAFGTAQALMGFLIRRRGGDDCNILDSIGTGDTAEFDATTAVVMPICNEDVGRVIEGMRVIFESVAATGHLPKFDFFLLSDSNDPNHWIEEEAAWLALTRQLGAQGRVFYRKRRLGTNKKAGNLADFCRRWGSSYRYMVVLDADSIMTGDAIVRLVRTMERNPGVGIIQGVPQLANSETIFARMQQFASRLYGPIFSAGLNYWQLGEANYWGHNAILRLAPFIEYCSLPDLPGDGPFAGRIMSHDFVEAALMRRAGWQVWLATELAGNYEECPANLIDYAKRDRRWLQGNLQHAGLLRARGLHAINRLHFLLGIFSYVSSPLWLTFLVISTVLAYEFPSTHGRQMAGSFDSYLPWSYQTQAVSLFVVTVVLLLLPKVLAVLDLKSRPKELAAFGGGEKLLAGIALETVFFTLLAPILMLFHTKFLVLTLCGRSVSWGAQRRGRAGESAWEESFVVHASHTVIGLVWAFVLLKVDRATALWMAPVLASLIFSIPASFLTGSLSLGLGLRRQGIFLTPEETEPASELTRLAERVAHWGRRAIMPELATDFGLLQAVVDPYVNAVHVSLLRAKDETPAASEERFASLRDKLLHEGPAALSKREKISLLLDGDSMAALHRDLWISPASRLAAWWTLALDHYNVIAPAPQTPLTGRSR